MLRIVPALIVCLVAVYADAAEPWGDISGRIVCEFYESPREIPTGGKDPLCKAAIFDESIRIQKSGGGLANVIVYVVDKPKRIHESTLDALPKTVELDHVDCQCSPHVTVVAWERQKLVVKNTDATAHNTNGAPGRRNPAFGVLLTASDPKGLEIQFMRATPSPFELTCSIHPWEKAYCLVVNNPYFAVTAADGSFEIKNLPSDEELTIRIWHERFGRIDRLQRRDVREDRHVTLKPGERMSMPTLRLPKTLMD